MPDPPAGDDAAPLPRPDAAIEIGVEDLAAMRDAGTAFALIDCREPDEFALCRIDGARLLPLSGFATAVDGEFARQLARAQPVVVYCHHGMRSLRAVQHLRRHGVARAFSLAGGIDAWSQHVDPSVSRY